MKKTLLALMMLSAAAAYAGEAEDRLLSVQSVYRAALHEQNSNDSKIIPCKAIWKARSAVCRLRNPILTV